MDAEWSREEAEKEWDAQVAHAEIADYKGKKGSARYWLEQDLKRTREEEIFEDGALEETSDQIKNATKDQRTALAQFVHTSVGSGTSEFFSGQRMKLEEPSEYIARLLGKADAPGDEDNVEDDAANAGGAGTNSSKDQEANMLHLFTC